MRTRRREPRFYEQEALAATTSMKRTFFYSYEGVNRGFVYSTRNSSSQLDQTTMLSIPHRPLDKWPDHKVPLQKRRKEGREEASEAIIGDEGNYRRIVDNHLRKKNTFAACQNLNFQILNRRDRCFVQHA